MMPLHLKEMFDGMLIELWHLHIKSKFWDQLFNTSRPREELLDQMAQLFFNHIKDSLFLDIISRVSRLNDPVKSSGKKNWNFASLKELVEADLSPQAIDLNLKQFTDETAKINPLFKEIRNRHIAHKDWERRNDPTLQIFPPHLALMLQAMRGFMNTIEMHYCKTTTTYDNIETSAEGDGNTLIENLKQLAILRGDKPPGLLDTWDLPI